MVTTFLECIVITHLLLHTLAQFFFLFSFWRFRNYDVVFLL